METKIKVPVLEADFLNDIIVLDTGKKAMMTPELKQRFIDNVIDSFWHSEKDQLDYVCFYNTGDYFCQRKKLKFDFKEQCNYWVTYNFTGATQEQVDDFLSKVLGFFETLVESKSLAIDQEIQKIEKEAIYFDQKYAKKILEKNQMLTASDWRVLPDVIDKYPGEKDMWIKWRATLRDQIIKKPSEFETSIEFFKYIYNFKFPIDPKKYWELYPEGDVEYLSTDDQWVKYDLEASSDFVESRLINLINYNDNYTESLRTIKKRTLDMMKILGIEDFYPVDYSAYTTEETE